MFWNNLITNQDEAQFINCLETTGEWLGFVFNSKMKKLKRVEEYADNPV